MWSESSQRQLLKDIVSHVSTVEIPAGTTGKVDLDTRPFWKFKPAPRGLRGILTEGASPVFKFTQKLIDETPRYKRGAGLNWVASELGTLVIDLFGLKSAREIAAPDVAQLLEAMRLRFESASANHELMIACSITPRYARSFRIGGVFFRYLDDFVKQESARLGSEEFQIPFQDIVGQARESDVYWFASVQIDECLADRASELGEIAVDLALVGVQLVLPYDPDLIGRLNARTSPRRHRSMSLVDGQPRYVFASHLPGHVVGAGLLEKLLEQGGTVLESVGHRVDAFVSRAAKLPILEQAWADSAYWFHEALAEPISTIAVAKFETAIEVLVHGENTSGCRRRLLMAMEAFFGLSKEKPLRPDSSITVEQFAAGLVTDRSRVLHGTWSTLDHSLRESRPNIEHLVGSLLVNYTVALDLYIDSSEPSEPSDSVEAFFAHANQIRSSRRSAKGNAT